MIVISMLLVIVGAVTLVIGVFFAGDNLQLVYVSIIACLLAGLFLVAGIIRGRSSRKAAMAGAGEAGAPASASAWGPSSTGASQGWGGAAAQETQVSEAAAPTVGASPAGQEDMHAPGPDESWAPAGDPLEDVGEGDVRILEPDEESTEVEPEGEVAQEEALRAQAPPEADVAPPKSVAKKTTRKSAGKKAAKAGGSKAAGKKTTKKAATAGGKKAAGKKAAAAGGKKAAGKKAAGKKAATAGGKKAATAGGKKAATAGGKKAAGKKAAAAGGKKAAGKKATGQKAASSGKQRIDTALADVSGVGDAKRQALADHFGSYQKLRNASVDEITEVRGISPALAERIYEGLRS